MSLKKNKQTLKRKQQKASGLRSSLFNSLSLKKIITSDKNLMSFWDRLKSIKKPEIVLDMAKVEASSNKHEFLRNLTKLVNKNSNSPQKKKQLIASIQVADLPKNAHGKALAIKNYIISNPSLKKYWDKSSNSMSKKFSPKIFNARKAVENSGNKQAAMDNLDKLKQLLKSEK